MAPASKRLNRTEPADGLLRSREWRAHEPLVAEALANDVSRGGSHVARLMNLIGAAMLSRK